jgi:hypothetical protein
MEILNQYSWLNEHATGWQFGEQGILFALCKRFGITKGYEIGAGDGDSLPVTLSFIDDLTLFEIDLDRQTKLRKKYPLATVYGEYTRPLSGMDGACVVVDVDSCDLAIAESIVDEYRPKVLCVEHYDTEGPRALNQDMGEPVSGWLIGVHLPGGFRIQQPWQVVSESLGSHGYRMVAKSRVNGIYVYEGQ